MVRDVARARAVLFVAPLLCSLPVGLLAETPLVQALRVSSETAPAGGWAQFKIWAAAPNVIPGFLAMDFDHSVFGKVASVAVLSAYGDGYGYAGSADGLDDLEVFIRGFIGNSPRVHPLPDLPFLVVTVPVLTTAAPGTTTAVTVKGVQVIPGSFTVGGTLAVRDVSPGGGFLPAGTVVRINGFGFSKDTNVEVSQVSISSTQYIGPQEIDVTLAAPTELTGKKFVLRNPDGSTLEHFSYLAGAGYLFPPIAFSGEYMLGFGAHLQGFGMENPNLMPVDIFEQFGNQAGPPGTITSERSFTLAGNSSSGNGARNFTTVGLIASGPISVLQLQGSFGIGILGDVVNFVFPDAAQTLQRYEPTVSADPPALSWQWQIGSPLPPPRSIDVSANFSYNLIPSGGSWFSGDNYQSNHVMVTVNPAGLAAGTYQGSILVAPIGPIGKPLTIPISLTVTPDPTPLLTANPMSLTFASPYKGSTTTQTIAITGSAGSGTFSARVQAFPNTNFGNWLSVSPTSGSIPGMLTVSVNPNQLLQLPYQFDAAANIVVTGPENTLTIPVRLVISSIKTDPEFIEFSLQAGTAVQTKTASVYLPNATTDLPAASVRIDSGGDWLSASVGLGIVSISVNPARLSEGKYTGAVTLTVSGADVGQIPVTAWVWDKSPGLTVTPSSLTLVYYIGGVSVPRQTLAIRSTTGVPVPVQWKSSIASLRPMPDLTPADVAVEVTSFPATIPGENDGTIEIIGPAGTVTVPVKVVYSTSPDNSPFIGSIVNAASQTHGAIAPGEIITIYGFGTGSLKSIGLKLDSSGNVATNYDGAKVLFDGRPAPLIYSSPFQTNAIVPYEIANQKSTTIEVVYNDAKSTARGIPVAASSPAIFTLDGSGLGQAAALNQDNSVNGPDNPAARGSVIQVFATGEGLTSPASVTGSITRSNVKTPLLPVTAKIGGKDATVQFAGSAPDSITGLLQVNVVVPLDVESGSTVPISIISGKMQSSDGVSIAVK